jgi:hypothetical protein
VSSLQEVAKVRLSLCSINEPPRHDDVCGGGGIAMLHLSSATVEGEWSDIHHYRFNPRGNSPHPYPLDRKLVDPHSRSKRCTDEKILALLGIEPRPSSPYAAAVPRNLSRLPFLPNNYNLKFFFNFRYMRALEDTLNFPFCGMFLILLTALCFVSFSAVAVKYFFLTMK